MLVLVSWPNAGLDLNSSLISFCFFFLGLFVCTQFEKKKFDGNAARWWNLYVFEWFHSSMYSIPHYIIPVSNWWPKVIDFCSKTFSRDDKCFTLNNLHLSTLSKLKTILRFFFFLLPNSAIFEWNTRFDGKNILCQVVGDFFFFLNDQTLVRYASNFQLKPTHTPAAESRYELTSMIIQNNHLAYRS